MCRRSFLGTLFLLMSTGSAWAAEQLNLTTPETSPSITDWRVASLRLGWVEQRIDIMLLGTNGESRTFSYSGTQATALMRALNKADLSVKSLQRRILERLIADGRLSGSVAGTPE